MRTKLLQSKVDELGCILKEFEKDGLITEEDIENVLKYLLSKVNIHLEQKLKKKKC